MVLEQEGWMLLCETGGRYGAIWNRKKRWYYMEQEGEMVLYGTGRRGGII